MVIQGKAYIPRRIETTAIRLKKIHKFASARWLNAENLETAKFWKGVMDWCVTKQITYRDPTFEEWCKDNRLSD